LSTTRSPTRLESTAGPTDSITPTTSCPSTWGKEINEVIGLSMAPFMNTCFASLPHTPQRRVRITSQSGAGRAGSGISRSWIGARGPTKARGDSADSSFVTTRRGSAFS
jgi:hypothetical protein